MSIMCEQWNENMDIVDIDNNVSANNKSDPECRYRLPRANKIQAKKMCPKELKNASLRKIASILQKTASDRTFEEDKILKDCSEEVKEIQLRWKKRDNAKKRLEEKEDPPNVLKEKCAKLAQAIAQAQHLVVYTGAGISTSAKIPDYRGPNGIWTRLQQGKEIGNHDLTLAEPTYTHMALYELYKRNILKYVVSQNCDGLHLRSGLPKTVLSELHGNMYLEVCKNCKPHKEYLRPFDVTENTSRYFHKTSRKCYVCNGALIDTIVHFGERGTLQWPLNWKGACVNAKKATTILCLGSSLRVLKKYPWLWQMDKPAKKRPNLYIVNLQWTPKDECANVKINGKCDEVMKSVMECLGIPPTSYDRKKDPILFHCTKLSEKEFHTTSQPFLKDPLEKQQQKQEQKPSDLSDNSTCDKKKIIVKIEPNEIPKTPQFHSVFSIDSILSSSQMVLPNYSRDLVYFHNEFYRTMSDFYYYSYPYQSSWLYSGLHSIIETKPEKKPELEEEMSDTNPSPACEFCHLNLNSLECLFYEAAEPVFLKEQFRFSKIEKKNKPNVCVCCDYTTDEEETPPDKEEEKDQNRGESPKVQAGWFGKGYKKGKRKRN